VRLQCQWLRAQYWCCTTPDVSSYVDNSAPTASNNAARHCDVQQYADCDGTSACMSMCKAKRCSQQHQSNTTTLQVAAIDTHSCSMNTQKSEPLTGEVCCLGRQHSSHHHLLASDAPNRTDVALTIHHPPVAVKLLSAALHRCGHQWTLCEHVLWYVE
jgi:hypothetical protein